MWKGDQGRLATSAKWMNDASGRQTEGHDQDTWCIPSAIFRCRQRNTRSRMCIHMNIYISNKSPFFVSLSCIISTTHTCLRPNLAALSLSVLSLKENIQKISLSDSQTSLFQPCSF